MDAQAGQKVAGYVLQNLGLEYETIENMELAKEIQAGYHQGGSLSFERKSLMKTVVWGKDSTLINETIKIPKKSMRDPTISAKDFYSKKNSLW